MGLKEHLAGLSKLKFTEAEFEKFDKEFEKILSFVSQITETKLDDDNSGINIHEIENLRSDEPHASFSVEEVLLNAPKKRDRYFVVPQVVE